MMNNVILIGRITKDVELRRTSKGTAVVEFNLAVPDTLNRDAEGKPTTDFISCVAWSNTAETMDKYVRKGNRLAIRGRLKTRNYDHKDGYKVYVTEVIVEKLIMLEKNNESTRQDEPGSNYQEVESPIIEYNITDDDLPF